MGSTAKEVIRKYLKMVKKPLFSHKHKEHQHKTVSSLFASKTERSAKETNTEGSFSFGKKEITESSGGAVVSSSSSSHSFSGNLRYPRRRSSYVSSCPSSMRSSPTHSGVLGAAGGRVAVGGVCYADSSTMEELQNAIQGAIAHCKNSLVQNKTMVSSEI